MDSLFEKIDEDHIKYKGEIFRFHGNYFIGKGHKYLHRLVYQDFHGKIPVRSIVHHKDGNTRNNSPDNLVLLTREEHSALHTKGRKLSDETKAKITGRPRKKVDRYSTLPFPPTI